MPNYVMDTALDGTWPGPWPTAKLEHTASGSGSLIYFALIRKRFLSKTISQSTADAFVPLWRTGQGQFTASRSGLINYFSFVRERFLSGIESQLTADELLFQNFAERWRRETKYLSSDHDIAMNPAYQSIIGMGDRAIPLILRDLQQNPEPSHWFWALTMITHENPVPPEEAGDMRRMRERWLSWGRTRLYLTPIG